MDVITTQSRGNQFVEVDKELILDETAKTKLVFKAGMHPGGIRGDIIRYRKDNNGICEPIVPVNFNSLHPDEGIKIELNTEATKKLYETLKELETVLEKKGVSAQQFQPLPRPSILTIFSSCKLANTSADT